MKLGSLELIDEQQVFVEKIILPFFFWNGYDYALYYWEVLMFSNQHDGMVGLSSSRYLKSQAMGHPDGICVENVKNTLDLFVYNIHM